MKLSAVFVSYVFVERIVLSFYSSLIQMCVILQDNKKKPTFVACGCVVITTDNIC